MIEIKVIGIEEMRALLKERLRTDPQEVIDAAMVASVELLKRDMAANAALNSLRYNTSGYLPSMLADGTFYPSKRPRKIY